MTDPLVVTRFIGSIQPHKWGHYEPKKRTMTNPTLEELLKPVANAMTSGRWLIAAFRVAQDPNDDGKLALHLDRTTHDFPKDKFNDAVSLLAKNLEQAD